MKSLLLQLTGNKFSDSKYMQAIHASEACWWS